MPNVHNDELLTVRDGMRELNKLVDSLAVGSYEKFVFTRHGKMVAVLVSVDEYDEMLTLIKRYVSS